MEEYFYIILLVVWLIVSLYKRSAKSKQQASKPRQQPDSTTSLPKETDLEQMLEDFFGGGKKTSETQLETDVEEVPSVTYESLEDDYDRVPPMKETPHTDREPAYQAWESKAQQRYDDKKRKPSEPEYAEPQYESFYKDTDSQNYSGLTEMGKVASVDELIRSHAAKDAMEQAKAEMAYGSGLSEDIPEFDLRTAVIFSEILTKKYNA
jgi:hypothetical protein